ncbi:hypothetical protein R6Q59_010120 [Mikania micrantha]
MKRTLRRYRIDYEPPPQHPRKTVNALRLLYAIDGEERKVLTRCLFRAYWVDGRDVSDDEELLRIVKESGVKSADRITGDVFRDAGARKQLETATDEAVGRGAFGVPGFWIPDAHWTRASGEEVQGRFLWGQDRMHFVEASLLSLQKGGRWHTVPSLRSLMPRCIPHNKVSGKVRLEFWYDFSSPWAFLGWTQIERLRRTFGPDLEIIMKPFLLGILFRQIGAPNLPSGALSPAKADWSRQDHRDWTNYWNAVNEQEGRPDKTIEFYWAGVFPIRTPTVLRLAMTEPSTVGTLYRDCWEGNFDVGDESMLANVLSRAGYDGKALIERANSVEIRAQLREATAEAQRIGLCGVPSYRILRQNKQGEWVCPGGIVWGQDEINVVEDMIAGWDIEASNEIAVPRKVHLTTAKSDSKL